VVGGGWLGGGGCGAVGTECIGLDGMGKRNGGWGGDGFVWEVRRFRRRVVWVVREGGRRRGGIAAVEGFGLGLVFVIVVGLGSCCVMLFEESS